MTTIATENQRLKQIREELGLTQAAMGESLALKSSTADIERGRMRVPGKVVMLLLQKYRINPLWLYGESHKQYLDAQTPNTMPQVITVAQDGDENIVMVQSKAAAGYGQNIQDEEYIAELPSFRIPLPEYRNASFRGFQITGDSMLPLVQSGDWVITKAVESIEDIHDLNMYIIVEADSIRLKKIKKLEDRLQLISLNPDYPPTEVLMEEVLEIWAFHSRISTNTDWTDSTPTLQGIQQELQEIKRRLP